MLTLIVVLCLCCCAVLADGGFRRGRVFADLPDASGAEAFEDLLTMPALGEVTVERIVSDGQASPEGFWYDQDWAEWVMILSGGAELEIAEPPEIAAMAPGDWAYLPAHCVHRVRSTLRNTVWLAVHAGRAGNG